MRDLLYLLEGEKTRTRTKPPLRPSTQAEAKRLWQGMSQETRAETFRQVEAEIGGRAQARWRAGQGIGTTHREAAAAVLRAVRRQSRPQGAVPELLRQGKGGRSAIRTWTELPPKYRSRVGFEVHEARVQGLSQAEQARVARAATQRLAIRQAGKGLRIATGLGGLGGRVLGPLGLVSEVLGYVRGRREGFVEPVDMDFIRPRKMPRVREPKV